MSNTQSGLEGRAEAMPIPASPQMAEAHETILLVEDEDFVRLVTREVLSSAGYEVLCARHAAEAARVFYKHAKPVQLLLTDVVLPGRNGRDLARDLQAAQPGLKTMFISGYPENSITRHGIEENRTPYLPKPFSADSLMRAVRRVLGQSREDADHTHHARDAG